MSDLARALLDELARDPVALERLRALTAAPAAPAPGAPAYTVRSLAAELGRTERAIRAAIARGELEAVKRGRGYVISAAAVAAWATAPAGVLAARRTRRRQSAGASARSTAGPMRRALTTPGQRADILSNDNASRGGAASTTRPTAHRR